MRPADQMGSPLVFSAQPVEPVTLTEPVQFLPSKTATTDECVSQFYLIPDKEDSKE